MALLIGVVGVYGLISYSVAQRRREIGIRLALGASSGGLFRIFVGHALVLGATGAACGIVVAAAVTRLISSLLFRSDQLTRLPTYSCRRVCSSRRHLQAIFLLRERLAWIRSRCCGPSDKRSIRAPAN
jgi:ABC-type antimicrobial peptide transport system permease subunit